MAKGVLAVDLFCGAGGSSTGLAQACAASGRRLDLTAINHWPTAVETHAANHPAARHLCAALDDIDPRRLFEGRRLDLLLASPECVHHSIARGGKPCSDQSRSTAWHVVRWADALRPRCILVENVREFQSWGPLGENGRPLKRRKGEVFRAWVQALEALGYTVSFRVLNAADYGAATTRERLYVAAVRGKAPFAWPAPTHGREGGADLFGAVPRWRAAREVIDWSLRGASIWNRKRPLKPKTLQRIYAGLRKFGGVEFLVPFFGEREGQEPRCHGLGGPLPTVTGHGAGGVVQPYLVQFKGTAPDQLAATARDIEEPLGTITAGGGNFGLAEPFVLGQQGGSVARPVGEPLPTITTGGFVRLAEPWLMTLSQSGSNGDRTRPAGRPVPTVTTADDLALVEPFLLHTTHQGGDRLADVDDPLATVTGAHRGEQALCEPFLVSYYGTGGPRSVDDPLDTVTTKDRFALVTVNGELALLDVLFRMLQPHELAAAMGFPAEYKFSGNRGEIVRQVGNAVEVNQARSLTLAALSRAA